ncbi:uncharacterized protein METZ01_LOCUS196642 [marine metagenome]|uniref:Uncharacterized protein n=1 Tax=marine metagenome TaxID=408172 RepID=A0A382DZG9_9ZZZZ
MSDMQGLAVSYRECLSEVRFTLPE